MAQTARKAALARRIAMSTQGKKPWVAQIVRVATLQVQQHRLLHQRPALRQ